MDAIKGVRGLNRLRGELSASVRAVIVFCEADMLPLPGLFGSNTRNTRSNKPRCLRIGTRDPPQRLTEGEVVYGF